MPLPPSPFEFLEPEIFDVARRVQAVRELALTWLQEGEEDNLCAERFGILYTLMGDIEAKTLKVKAIFESVPAQAA